MKTALKFAALYVPDLKSAEEYYLHLFNMQVYFREVELDDGKWYTLKPGTTWEQIEKQGIQVDMIALKRDGFILPLFPSEPIPGQIFTIGLVMTQDEIKSLVARLGLQEIVIDDNYQHFFFQDQFGIRWQINSHPYTFSSNGDSLGQWLEI